MQIKEEKALLRVRYKQQRATVAGQREKAAAAAENLLHSGIYAAAEQIFCYYPHGSEMDTTAIVQKALTDKKKTALPVCRDKNGHMDFYYIESLDSLKRGLFGIAEPDTAICRVAADFANTLLIVPALAFDKNGYRLGYGGGYYDKFLEKFTNDTSYSVGLCYNELISGALPREAHDMQLDYICTEQAFFKTKAGSVG